MHAPNPSRILALAAAAILVAIALAFLSRRISAAGSDTASRGRSATGNNVFAIALYQQLARSPGNAVFSPLSIRTALATTLAGARGETAQEMVRALRLPDGEPASISDCGALAKELNGRNAPGSEILSANALFIHSGFPVRPEFRAMAQKSFSSEINELDFANSAAARRQINDWVARHTQNKISGILPASLPDTQTPLIIVNTIWFKGKWMTRFDPAATRDEHFHVTSDKTVSVPTMHLTGDFPFAETESFQTLELPYVSRRFSMVIVLPLDPDKLPDLEKQLTPSDFAHLSRTADVQEIHVALPRFKERCHLELNDSLKDLGMTNAFSGDADFSGITREKPFFIDTVLHNACVEVDEEGTTAAAGTGVAMSRLAPSPAFVANHPFLFAVRDNQTGAILFLGRLAAPSRE